MFIAYQAALLVHQPDADVGGAPDSTSTIPSFINIYLCSFQKETDDLPLEASTAWLYWWVLSLTSKSPGSISQQKNHYVLIKYLVSSTALQKAFKE